MRALESFVLFVGLVTFVNLENCQVDAQFAHPSIWMQGPKTYQVRTTTETPKATETQKVEKTKGKLFVKHCKFIFCKSVWISVDPDKARALKIMKLLILKQLIELRKTNPIIAEAWNRYERKYKTNAS